ncbi:MAG: hypothetical protein AVDCRST_MAG83-1167, partial [uncultured Arthrobacter sp.]
GSARPAARRPGSRRRLRHRAQLRPAPGADRAGRDDPWHRPQPGHAPAGAPAGGAFRVGQRPSGPGGCDDRPARSRRRLRGRPRRTRPVRRRPGHLLPLPHALLERRVGAHAGAQRPGRLRRGGGHAGAHRALRRSRSPGTARLSAWWFRYCRPPVDRRRARAVGPPECLGVRRPYPDQDGPVLSRRGDAAGNL